MANPFEKYLSVEDWEHIRLVNYIKDKLPEVISLHIPNESKKTAFERYKFSLFGILKGAPDFLFLHPKYESNCSKNVIYHGLAIELKAPEHNTVIKSGKKAGKVVKKKGKISTEQEDVIFRLNQMGYKANCCFGSEEAISIIDDYFKDYFELKKILNNK